MKRLSLITFFLALAFGTHGALHCGNGATYSTENPTNELVYWRVEYRGNRAAETFFLSPTPVAPNTILNNHPVYYKTHQGNARNLRRVHAVRYPDARLEDGHLGEPIYTTSFDGGNSLRGANTHYQFRLTPTSLTDGNGIYRVHLLR